MSKSAAKEPLMNTFARSVGRAAGTIAKATQELAANAAAVVHKEVPKTAASAGRPAKAGTKPSASRGQAGKKKSSAAKKKSNIAKPASKSAARKPSKRASR
jgi:hypothetical protein